MTAANGLLLHYTGVADSATSAVRYARGLGGTLSLSAKSMLDSGSGTISLQRSAAENSIASLERRETDILSRLERYRASLVEQFARMETVLGRLQGQGQCLTSQVDAMNRSNR